MDLPEHLVWMRVRGLAPASIRQRRNVIGRINRGLGKSVLTASQAELDSWQRGLAVGVVSRANYVGNVRAYFRWARDHNRTTSTADRVLIAPRCPLQQQRQGAPGALPRRPDPAAPPSADHPHGRHAGPTELHRRRTTPGRHLASAQKGTIMTDWYSVAVDAVAPAGAEPLPPDDPRVDRLADLAEPHHGSVAGGAGVWSVRLSLKAAAAADASTSGAALARDLGTAAGLPAWPIARVEATREDLLEVELATSNLPDLVSAPEVAAILGVSRQRVHQLLAENRRFPPPIIRLGSGPLWLAATIRAFDSEWTRKPGRPAGSVPRSDVMERVTDGQRG